MYLFKDHKQTFPLLKNFNNGLNAIGVAMTFNNFYLDQLSNGSLQLQRLLQYRVYVMHAGCLSNLAVDDSF